MQLPLPERWKKLGPLLDELLSIDARRRARKLAWLEAAGDPQTAEDLRAMLSAYSEALRVKFMQAPAARLHGTRPALVGATVGGYAIEALLGGGSSGSVWLATNRAMTVPEVALKILHLSDAGGAGGSRLTHEAELLRVLEHPNIARLHATAATQLGQPVLVLELVRGPPITHYCTARRLAAPARLALFGQVLDAVAFAHAHRIVHGDIHPAHVLVGAGGKVKLIDFSIAAREIDGGPGEVAFTPPYGAPEQRAGVRATAASDVFALGLLMRELLPPSGARRRDALERAVDQLVRKATARDPGRRFASAGEMGLALRRCVPLQERS